MTLGFLLIFFGIQLNVVRTYTLTPKATQFWMENIEEPALIPQPVQAVYNNQPNSPYSQASYGSAYGNGNYVQQAPAPSMLRAKQLTPPDWICWPFIFVGGVFVLYGLLLGRH